jgi:hypothetical protein
LTRIVGIESLCGCATELLDYGPGDRTEDCELRLEDCEEGAIVLLRSAFWDWRLAGKPDSVMALVALKMEGELCGRCSAKIEAEIDRELNLFRDEMEAS